MSELLRTFISLVPQIDESQLAKAGTRAGKTAGSSITSELTAGFKDGVRKGLADVEAEGSKSGKQTGRKFSSAADTELAKGGKEGGKSFAGGMKSSVLDGVKAIAGPMVALFAADKVKDFFGSALDEARESQKVGALTTQVIKSTGGAAKISADQVGDLATAISNKTGIDDEAIQSGSNLLLTFKNIKNEAGSGNDIFNQTTSIMTDMASAMGKEPSSAAIQLGKALNDPVKGITALTKVGVSFDDAQKKQIKTLVQSGDVMGAQKIILKELNSEFGGAAEAQATAGDKMATTWANFQEAVGTAVLPALDAVLTTGASVVGWMTESLPGAVDTVKGALSPVGDLFGAAFGQIRPIIDGIVDEWPVLVQAFTTGDWGFSDNPIFAFLEEIAGKAGMLRDTVIQLMPQVRTTLQHGFDVLQANVLPVIRQLATFFVTTLIPAAGALAQTFVTNVLPVLTRVFGFIETTLLPNLQRIGSMILTQVVPAVLSFVQGFVANALPAIQKVAGFVSGTLVPGFLQIQAAIVRNVMPIVQSLVTQFTVNVLPALSSLWQTITTKVVPILIRVGQVIAPVVVWLATLVANILGKVIPVLINLAGPIIGGLIRAVGSIVAGIAGFVGKLIDWGIKIGTFAKGVWDAMVGAKDKVVGAWSAIQSKIDAVKTWVTTTFAAVWAGVKSVVTTPITNAKTALDSTWAGIKGAFSTVKGWVSSVFSREWAGIKRIITDPIDAAKTAISTLLGVTGLQKVFSGAVTAIGRIWGGISGAVQGPINTVIGFINSTFIGGLNWLLSKIPGVSLRIPRIAGAAAAPATPNRGGGGQARYSAYADGGVLDGYTPGKDVHQFFSPTGGQLDLSGGESIMRPEWTKAVGAGFVSMMNAAARTGGVSGVRRAMGFAGGGIWDVGRSVLGGLTGTGNPKDLATVGLAAYDTWEKAKAFVVNAFNGLLKGAGSSFAGQAFLGTAGAIRDGVVRMAQDAFGFGGGGGTPGSAGGKGGQGWQWQWNLIRSHFPAATLTSSYRPGAKTAGYGTTSYHALGRAIDIGGTPSLMSSIAQWILANYGSTSGDLLYSPLWGHMGIYHGKWARQNDTTWKNHFSHVHWGYKDGGIPEFDQGGVLAPGVNVVQNNLGRPEPLVRADQATGTVHYHIAATIDAKDLQGLRSLEEFVELFPVKSLQYQGA